MAMQSLLLCRDPEVVGILRPMLDELGLAAEVCTVPRSAHDLLLNRKYDPVIVDCDLMDGDGELLRSVRESPANRDSIALGIIGDNAEVDAFALGANLVIRKPVDCEEAGRILRTARALVRRMRRRFLRQVLHTLAYVRVNGRRETLMLLDIGEGGLALQALDRLEERRAFSIRFTLPGDAEDFVAVATAVWNDASGRVGLRFIGMPAACRQRLKTWLEQRGATGQADVPPEELPLWAEERVHFPLQLAPIAHGVCSALFDVVIVSLAVVLFGVTSWLITGEAPPFARGRYAVLLLGCVSWLLYRYVFFGGLSMTPGSHVAAVFSDRALVWMYNRRNDRIYPE